MKLQNCLLILLLVFITACGGQDKLPVSENVEKTPVVIAKEDPQIAEYIRHIFQDKNGDFWLGTNDLGVAHYNGDTLVYYSHQQDFGGTQITGITEDPDKNLWFATDQGVVKYDYYTTEEGDKIFTNYADPEVFHGDRFWSIFADSKGVIWAGSGQELFRFNGTDWELFELLYAKDAVNTGLLTGITTWSIMEDRLGNIWFGTDGNGAIKYNPSAEKIGNGKSFIQYTTKEGLTDSSVDPIIEDKRGNIWLGTRNGGLSKFNGKNFTNFTANDSIGNNEVCIVYEDKAGNIWLSSEGFGVYKYNGVSFTNYYKEQGLEVKAPQAIFEDIEGRLWVGGGGGLFRLEGETFINVTKNGPWK